MKNPSLAFLVLLAACGNSGEKSKTEAAPEVAPVEVQPTEAVDIDDTPKVGGKTDVSKQMDAGVVVVPDSAVAIGPAWISESPKELLFKNVNLGKAFTLNVPTSFTFTLLGQNPNNDTPPSIKLKGDNVTIKISTLLFYGKLSGFTSKHEKSSEIIVGEEFKGGFSVVRLAEKGRSKGRYLVDVTHKREYIHCKADLASEQEAKRVVEICRSLTRQ